ncbi:family 20 glycosylhydrolase [Mariniflexile jejuense]|uniref:Family 20 glycosylhydrolase n=1 Tax=Mariniflexile jejuense TaxID=1173582 RepID=A0ABW3JL43_9FLAO
MLNISLCLAQIIEEELPVRGFTISAPRPSELGKFTDFVEKYLSKTNVNTLFLMVNYKYQFESHPELAETSSLSQNDVKKIVTTCKNYGITIVPLINLLGHQSWKQDNIKSLLKVYPQFEENPGDKLQDKDFYCRSYCPLHPEVHAIVFDLVDELIKVFEAKAIHVGMDEVFVLGEDSCSRCKGKNKAKLFADEVTKIYNHLESKGVNMYMWGDRLLDGKTTGLGKWSASHNDTHPAIDLISKNIIICDWQYKTAPPTPAYFAMKGFKVISCSFEVPEVAIQQLDNVLSLRKLNKVIIKNRLLGVMHTYWSTFDSFIDCYENSNCNSETIKGAVETFKTMYENDK